MTSAQIWITSEGHWTQQNWCHSMVTEWGHTYSRSECLKFDLTLIHLTYFNQQWGKKGFPISQCASGSECTVVDENLKKYINNEAPNNVGWAAAGCVTLQNSQISLIISPWALCGLIPPRLSSPWFQEAAAAEAALVPGGLQAGWHRHHSAYTAIQLRQKSRANPPTSLCQGSQQQQEELVP